MIREIVHIDEEKCNGCGLCVPACAEGAIQLINGKAKLIADNLCDGIGACLGHCPQGAILIEKRAAAEFDEEAVAEHLHAAAQVAPPAPASACGCPSAAVKSFAPPQHGHGHGHGHSGGCPSAALRNFAPVSAANADVAGDRPSELRQWPVQMHLVPPTAPFLNGADLLLAADCAPFAYADFHRDLLKGKALLIGCPKLDDGQAYLEKLTAMLRLNAIKSLTVAHMEVPCCSGLIQIAKRAIAESGKEVPLTTIRIGIQGDLK
jgi:Fe-S-cluster-containing hydrogenase component 2